MNEFEALQKYLESDEGTYVRGFEEVSDPGVIFEIEGINGEFKTIEAIEGDEGRWTRHMKVIVQAPSGKMYQYAYGRGLTEYQNNTYYGNLVEVLPHVQTVTIVEYKAVAA